jgi:hypothetical protein
VPELDVVLGGDPLSGSSSKGLILDLHASPVERPFDVSLREGLPSTDLVGTGKEVVQLRTGYPSEIQPPFDSVRSRRVVPQGARPARGISLSPSLFGLVSALLPV